MRIMNQKEKLTLFKQFEIEVLFLERLNDLNVYYNEMWNDYLDTL